MIHLNLFVSYIVESDSNIDRRQPHLIGYCDVTNRILVACKFRRSTTIERLCVIPIPLSFLFLQKVSDIAKEATLAGSIV